MTVKCLFSAKLKKPDFSIFADTWFQFSPGVRFPQEKKIVYVDVYLFNHLFWPIEMQEAMKLERTV